jgi:hypothetical protein
MPTRRLALRSVSFVVAFAGLTGLAEHRALAAAPWVDRHLTLPSGDWAFDFGLGVGHAAAPDETAVGVNAEMAVGFLSRFELGVRTGVRFGDDVTRLINADDYGRLFDRQTLPLGAEGDEVLANPEVRFRGAIVRDEIVELGLEGRVVLPFADGTVAGMLAGLPLAFHLGSRVRLDTAVDLPVVFYRDDTVVGLHLPLDVWIQATRRFWIGPMTGLAFDYLGDRRGTTSVSLGLGLGYEITHALDLKGMFLFPDINDESRDFGLGAGIEVRVE